MIMHDYTWGIEQQKQWIEEIKAQLDQVMEEIVVKHVGPMKIMEDSALPAGTFHILPDESNFYTLPEKVAVQISLGGPVATGTITGVKAEKNPAQNLQEIFPALGEAACCPVDQEYRDCHDGIPLCIPEISAVANRIVHLNDIHQWSREQIADWLEGLGIDLSVQAHSEGD